MFVGIEILDLIHFIVFFDNSKLSDLPSTFLDVELLFLKFLTAHFEEILPLKPLLMKIWQS